MTDEPLNKPAADAYIEITREPASLKLKAGESARVECVVTNKTGKKDRIRAVIPQHAKLQLTVIGEDEVMVEKDATTSFAVEIKANVAATPGDEDITLKFVADRDSDRFAATAPAVRVTIAVPVITDAVVTKPVTPFPWWIVAVVGGVLVVTLAVVWALSTPQPLALGVVCKINEDCAGGLSCIKSENGVVDSEQVKVLKCLKPLSATCSQSPECATGYCKLDKTATGKLEPSSSQTSDGKADNAKDKPTNGTCTERAAVSSPCSEDAECNSPAKCTRGTCLFPVQAACKADAECETRWCPGGEKPELPKVCTAFGAPCGDAAPPCGKDLACAPEAGNRCLSAMEVSCPYNALCASGFCDNGICKPAPLPGTPCKTAAECGAQLTCLQDKCLKPAGLHCDSEGECASSRCTSQVCEPFGGPGDNCAKSENCTGGYECSDGKCLAVTGAACGAVHSACASNYCASTCQPPNLAGASCDPNSKPCQRGLVCENNQCKLRYRVILDAFAHLSVANFAQAEAVSDGAAPSKSKVRVKVNPFTP